MPKLSAAWPDRKLTMPSLKVSCAWVVPKRHNAAAPMKECARRWRVAVRCAVEAMDVSRGEPARRTRHRLMRRPITPGDVTSLRARRGAGTRESPGLMPWLQDRPQRLRGVLQQRQEAFDRLLARQRQHRRGHADRADALALAVLQRRGDAAQARVELRFGDPVAERACGRARCARNSAGSVTVCGVNEPNSCSAIQPSSARVAPGRQHHDARRHHMRRHPRAGVVADR